MESIYDETAEGNVIRYRRAIMRAAANAGSDFESAKADREEAIQQILAMLAAEPEEERDNSPLWQVLENLDWSAVPPAEYYDGTSLTEADYEVPAVLWAKINTSPQLPPPGAPPVLRLIKNEVFGEE